MDKNELQVLNNFVIFKTDSGKVNIDVYFKDDTLWLTQKLMGVLFEKGRSTISEHLKNIFSDGELDEKVVCRKFRHTTQHGAIEGKTQTNTTNFYNLKAIVAVGYRANSNRAIEFRKWATEVLHEYIIKGFAMDDERLKNLQHFGKDYFDEMLERIREIRLSERRFYQKITDIYALSADYDVKSATTKNFFASVQNKLHWAIQGKTSAEIIYTSADATKIGHGAKDIEVFIDELKSFDIEYLLDIRTSPFSKWHPQFNQNSLKFSLSNNEITYVYMGDALGGLPDDEDCYDKKGKVMYKVIKDKQFFKDGLARLVTANEKNLNVAIMCSEANPAECHRSKLVGEQLLKQYQISLRHIIDISKEKEQFDVILEFNKGVGLTDLFGKEKILTSRNALIF